MTNEEKEKIALFRYGIISELVSGLADSTNKDAYFRTKASLNYVDSEGKPFNISEKTIERWYYRYQKYGFDALKPKGRNDLGRVRKLDSEVLNVIKYYVEEHPRMPATLIYDELIKNHYITVDEVSLSTVTRYVSRLKRQENIIEHSEMKRYEAEHINDIWCCDTTYSFKLTVNGEKKRMFIMAIIDDASRMIVGIDVFFNDNYVNFMSVLKQAVTKYGKPKILNLDNGAPYKNGQIELLSARIGTTLFHNKPYFGQGKAKIERWFRTMKEHFMASFHLTTKTTIDEFKYELLEYVVDYNNSIHSQLKGKTPIERFFDSSDEILRLDNELIEKSFLLEIERKATFDCVIQIDNIEFEVPQKYGNKKIKIRYSEDYKTCYVVTPEGELEKITLLDKVANSKMKRKQPIFNTEAQQ